MHRYHADSLDYSRHFVLLVCAAGLLAATNRWRQSLGTAASFGLYGAVHSMTVSMTLRAAHTLARKLLFIAISAACSWLTVMLGFHGSHSIGMLPAMVRPALLLSVSSGAGAVSYALLIRAFWMPGLPLRALLVITLGSVLSTLGVLTSGVFMQAGGGLWFAGVWWFAFSAGLWYYDGMGASKTSVVK